MNLNKQKKEVWTDAPVPGYRVSDLGRVYSLRGEGRYLAPSKGRRGDLRVHLSGQQWTLAHVVYFAFMGRKPTYVQYADRDKTNCELKNLIWARMPKKGN